jgi:dipeptidyl-peptidase 4
MTCGIFRRVRLGLCALALLTACRGAPPKPTPAEPAAPAQTSAPFAWPALDEAFIESWAMTQGFRLGKPQPLAIAPDGTVLYRRTAARERRAELHLLGPTGGDQVISVDTLLGGATETLSNEERARRERTRTTTSGIVDIDLSADGRRILIPLGERVFVWDRDKGSARPLDLGAGYPLDPHISPDGQNVSFVRDGDLWVMSLAQGRPRKLTAHEKDIEYGSAEFVAQEEFDRARGHWWSPDSRTLLFQKSDLRKVDTLYVADARHPDQTPVPFKYPRPGANNAIVSLALQALRGGAPRFIAWDQARFPYVANVQWPEHGPLSLVVLNRAQTELALLVVDADSGATRVLATAQDPAWVNVPVGAPRWLEDGSGFLWMTESASGWTLERRDRDGALLKTLTGPEFGLRAIVGLEPKSAAAIVLASTDPRQQHVWRVPLDGSAPQPFTDGGGVNTALARHGVIVISGALHQGGTSSLVIHANGVPEQLPSLAERPALAPTTDFESVEVRENGETRTLYTAITRPRNFDPKQRYPVLLKVYGGPGVTNVLDYRDAYTLDQWYADAGFVVMRADGRGTPNRGRAWERAIKDDLITLPLNDQVVALDAMIARHPELDRSRVGLFGWSFGGYLSSMALLFRPDVFKAAVAGAPVSDWSLYDSAYTERYLRTPQDNPEGYKKSSALTYASELQRPLLILHGVTDDNVHFAHTLAFIEALFRAGKRAELITLPTTHLLADPKLSLAREKVQIDFFRDHLAPIAP